MSGFDKRDRGDNKRGFVDDETKAAYKKMRSDYIEQRERFIQDVISEKRGQIKQKMINKEPEQDIKKFITWEFTCINTYKKNEKIHRSGMTGKIVGTKGVDYNNPPSFREVEEIYQEIKSSLPRELNAEEKWQADFAKKQEQWRAQQEVDPNDSCDSEIYGDPFADYEEELKQQEKQDEKWEKEYQEQCKQKEEEEKCKKRTEEIKELHKQDLGIKSQCNEKRKAQLRHRMLATSGKQSVVGIDKTNMTKEQAQKVIPTLDLGDDIQEIIPEGEEEIVTKYRVIKKDDGSTLHSDWKVIWKKEENSRIKYYNPTFKLEIFEKPIKDKPQFTNKHIRENLKNAYDKPENKRKIIIWNPVREQGMVDIYEKLVDNSEPINTLFTNIEDRSEQEKAQSVITMGWDDTEGNERPYYKYMLGSTKILTYEPPMHLLSSFSYNITSTDGNYTNKKVSAEEGLKGGKRKTQKKKQPKQKRAGSTKKAKKGGKKTSQKKGKQQKRGTRGKK